MAHTIKPIAANTSGRGVSRARSRPSPTRLPAAATAIRTLKDEHLAIASVLFGLRLAVGRIHDDGIAPDFRLLQALLDYIVAFPERLHHPKESLHLFTALASRCPEARKLTDELEGEHARGAALIESLRESLATYRREPQALEAFVRAVDAYADFHGRHMEKEESLVFPLAQKCLVASDWERIAAAFLENDNPLRGIRPKREVESLFLRVLALLPGKPEGRAGKSRAPASR